MKIFSSILTSFLFLFLWINNTISQETITGTVVSLVDDKPLSDIDIRVEGVAGLVETSGQDGKFSIEVPSENATLLFSYPGYKDYSMYLGEQNDFKVKMVPENLHSVLDYVDMPSGAKQKRFIIRSYVQVSDAELKESSEASLERMLSGKVTGLNATAYNGAPGAGTFLNIRGLNSLYAGSQPLYIVDGVAINRINPGIASRGTLNSEILNINPGDIESVTVLKDAIAKGIYGSRGANGVILINTYKGEKGSSKIDFSMNFGTNSLNNTMDVQDGPENRQYLVNLAHSQYNDSALVYGVFKEYLFNDTSSVLYQKYNNNTDWVNLIKQKGFYQNYHFRLRGGDDVSNYSFSVGFRDQKGVIINNNMQRLTARFSLDYIISNKLKIGNKLSFSRITQLNQMQGNSRYNPLLLSYRKSPLTAPYKQDEEGVSTPVYEDYGVFGISNPVSLVNKSRNDYFNTSITGTIYGEYNISKSLLLYAGVSLDNLTQQERIFIPSQGIVPFEDMERISEQSYGSHNLLDSKLEIKYSKKLNGAHHLSSFTGTELINDVYRKRFSRSYNSTSDDFPNLNQGAIFDTLMNGNENFRMISFYENLDYAYKEKYLVSATVRVDASSRFGLNNRIIAFPAIGMGWRISREDFMKDNDWIDELKLRAGVGYTGNDNIGNYTSRLLYGPANYKNLGGIVYSQIANEKMKPEITREINAGIDWSILNQQVNLSVDIYDRLNTNMLIYGKIPLEAGMNNLVNEGMISNRGIDLSLFINSKPGNFTWNIGADICYNKNEIKKFPEEELVSYNSFYTLILEGQPAGIYYGYETDGIIETDEEASSLTNGGPYTYEPFQAGDIKFKDLNNDGIIDENDKTFLGKASPDLYGGVHGGIGFMGFELTALADIQVGRKVINGFRYVMESMSVYSNQSTAVNERWQQEGDMTEIPRLAYDDPSGNNRFSDRWIEDGSFMRIKNLKLSYNFNQNIAGRLYLKNLRVFISTENLFTFTNYSGSDPEFNHLGSELFSGVDYFSIPLTRYYNAGIMIDL